MLQAEFPRLAPLSKALRMSWRALGPDMVQLGFLKPIKLPGVFKTAVISPKARGLATPLLEAHGYSRCSSNQLCRVVQTSALKLFPSKHPSNAVSQTGRNPRGPGNVTRSSVERCLFELRDSSENCLVSLGAPKRQLLELAASGKLFDLG